MSRSRLFIENFVIYGFGNVLGKIVPLLLLPVITRLVPDTSKFGIFDLFTVIVSFGTSFAVLGSYDAMFRLFFDDEDKQHKRAVCSNALRIVVFSGLILLLFFTLFRNSLSEIMFSERSLASLIIIAGAAIFFSALNSIVAAPTRMQNKRMVFVIMSILNPAVNYGVVILFVLKGKALEGLIAGTVIASLIQLAIFWHLNNSWFSLSLGDNQTTKSLLKIGIPLVPTFLIYWIFSSTDRIMISHMIGTSELGIYAIGSRLARISQFIYVAFAGGWGYFTFSTMKDNDHTRVVSKVFEYLGLLSFLSLIIIYPFIPYIFHLLFTGDYVNGYVVFPYLFISPLLLMLFQTSSSQLMVIKQSHLITATLLSGAIINIICNFVLIPEMGIEGAALATFLGYIFSLLAAVILARYKGLLYVNNRIFFFSSISIVLLGITRTLYPFHFGTSITSSGVLIIIALILYKTELIKIYHKTRIIIYS